MQRLTEREIEAVATALSSWPAGKSQYWAWSSTEPDLSLDQRETVDALRQEPPPEGLLFSPEVALALCREFGKRDRVTEWHLNLAYSDLKRSIPDFRRSLESDPQALAEELRRAE